MYNYNFTELILDGIKELKENPLYFFGGNELLIENNNVLELETCSIKTGLYKTYSFNFNELKFLGEFLSDNLCSCRIVDIIF